MICESPLYPAVVWSARGALRFTERLGLWRRPRTVHVESTNRCNYHCRMCPRDELERPLGCMEFDRFCAIARQCAAWGVRLVHLHGFGEPLLDPAIFQKIRYAKRAGIPSVRLFTNGLLLDASKRTEVFESGLDQIKISLDALNPNDYSAIRHGAGFERVLENIEALLREKKERSAERPLVTVLMVGLPQNRPARDTFLRRWRSRGVGAHITSLHNWANAGSVNGRRLPCLRLWQTMTIHWNGDVALCGLDYNGRVRLGNVHDRPLHEIFSSPEIERYRQAHRAGAIDELPLCEGCTARR